MKVTVKSKKDNISNITVKTEAGRGKEPYKKTARQFANHVNVPGFRKGKAPIKIIEDRVGKETIIAETMDKLLSELLFEAFEKEGLDVISIPSVDKVDFKDPEDAIHIEATIELVPEVKLGKYKGLKVSVNVPKFEEKEYMEQTLEKITSQFATYEESDKAIEMKDEVTFDFEAKNKETGESVESLKAEGFQTILEPSKFIGDFTNHLVGMKTGDEKEFDFTLPDEYHDEKLKGKEVVFKVKVGKVAKANIPVIDDELAKKVQAKDLEDLKSKITEEMKRIQEMNEKTASADALIDELVKGAELTVPDSMIQRELDAMLAQFKQNIEKTGQDFEDIKKGMNLDSEKDAARERITKSLVLSRVIKEEKLDITDKDLKEAALQIPNAEHMLKNPQFLSNLKLDLLTEKAVDLIREEAKIDYKYVVAHDHGDGKPCTHDHSEEKKPAKKKAAAKKPAAKKKASSTKK